MRRIEHKFTHPRADVWGSDGFDPLAGEFLNVPPVAPAILAGHGLSDSSSSRVVLARSANAMKRERRRVTALRKRREKSEAFQKSLIRRTPAQIEVLQNLRTDQMVAGLPGFPGVLIACVISFLSPFLQYPFPLPPARRGRGRGRGGQRGRGRGHRNTPITFPAVSAGPGPPPPEWRDL